MYGDYSNTQVNIGYANTGYVNIRYVNTACNGLIILYKPTQLDFSTNLVLTLLGELEGFNVNNRTSWKALELKTKLEVKD